MKILLRTYLFILLFFITCISYGQISFHIEWSIYSTKSWSDIEGLDLSFQSNAGRNDNLINNFSGTIAPKISGTIYNVSPGNNANTNYKFKFNAGNRCCGTNRRDCGCRAWVLNQFKEKHVSFANLNEVILTSAYLKQNNGTDLHLGFTYKLIPDNVESQIYSEAILTNKYKISSSFYYNCISPSFIESGYDRLLSEVSFVNHNDINKSPAILHYKNIENEKVPISREVINPDVYLSQKDFDEYQHISFRFAVKRSGDLYWNQMRTTNIDPEAYRDFWKRDALNVNISRSINFSQRLYCSHDFDNNNDGEPFYRRGYEFFRYLITPYIDNLKTLNNKLKSTYCEDDIVTIQAPVGYPYYVYNWQYSDDGKNYVDLPQFSGKTSISINSSTLSGYVLGEMINVRLKTYTNEFSDVVNGFKFIPTPPKLIIPVVPALCASSVGGKSYVTEITLSKPLKSGEKIVFNGREDACGSNTSGGTCFSATGGDLVIKDDFIVTGTTYRFKKANRSNDGIPNYDSIVLSSTNKINIYYVADLNGSGYVYPADSTSAQAIIDANKIRTCAPNPIQIQGVFPLAPNMDNTVDILYRVRHIGCNGGNDGMINVTNAYKNLAVGQEASWKPATYHILPATSLGETNNTTGIFNNLIAQKYEVWFTTINGCKSDTLKISVTEALTRLSIDSPFTFIQEISSVKLTDGKLQVNVPATKSGWGNLVFEWHKNGQLLPGETTNALSDLAEGSYTVIVKDNNGNIPFCTNSLSYTLTKPLPLKIDAIPVRKQAACYESKDGVIQLYFHGGNPYGTNKQFYYSITNNATGLQVKKDSIMVDYTNYKNNGRDSIKIDGLGKGNYKLQLFYKNVETDTLSFSITAPDTIKATVVDIISANGRGQGGAVKISVTGGSGNYEYQWSDDNTFTVLPEGVNTIERTNMTSNDVYFKPLKDYQITIRNKNNAINNPSCKEHTLTGIYVDKDKPNIKLTYLKYATPATSNGAIGVNVTKGKQPYVNIKWVLKGNTDTVTHIFAQADTMQNIAAGAYYVLVQDASGFTVDAFIYLPEMINGIISQTAINRCFGNKEAALKVLASGGDTSLQTGYTYQWLNANKQPLASKLNNIGALVAGDYYVNITDKRDSNFVAGPYNITQPTLFKITGQNIVPPTCNNTKDGKIEVLFDGGTPPYKINWDGTVSDSSVISNLALGQYTIHIKDSLGCPSLPAAEELVKLYDLQPASDLQVLDAQTVVTMPATEQTTDGSVLLKIKDAKHGTNFSLSYSWKDRLGNLVEQQSNVQPDNSGIVHINFVNKPFGEYFLHMVSDKGCEQDRSFVLIGPDQIIVRVYPSGVDSVKCHQKQDANLIPIIYKGSKVTNVTRAWLKVLASGEQFITKDSLLQNIGAGTYKITVKGLKSNNIDIITATAVVTLQEQPKIIVDFTKTIDEHCDQADGIIFGQVAGGRSSGPYKYTWARVSGRQGFSLIDSNQTILNQLSEGKYRLYAIENKYQCKDSSDVSIKNTFIDFNTILQKPICAGAADGKIYIAATGGKEVGDKYKYQLVKVTAIPSPSDTIKEVSDANSIWFTGVTKGKYKVVVSTRYNCQQVKDIEMVDPAVLSIDAGADKKLCIGSIHTVSPVFASSDGAVVDTTGWKFQWYHYPDNLNSILNVLEQYPITGAAHAQLQVKETDLNTGKRFLLKGITNKQCVVIDSINLTPSNQRLLASFLVTEHAFTNEEITAVNTSGIAPYSQWILPAGCQIVPNFIKDTSYVTFKFGSAGVYKIQLRAYNKDQNGQIACESILAATITVTDPAINNRPLSRLPSMFKIGYPKITPNPISLGQLKMTADVYFNEIARVYIVEMGSSNKIDLPNWNLVKGITNTYNYNISGLIANTQYAVVIETPKERKVLPFLKL